MRACVDSRTAALWEAHRVLDRLCKEESSQVKFYLSFIYSSQHLEKKQLEKDSMLWPPCIFFRDRKLAVPYSWNRDKLVDYNPAADLSVLLSNVATITVVAGSNWMHSLTVKAEIFGLVVGHNGPLHLNVIFSLKSLVWNLLGQVYRPPPQAGSEMCLLICLLVCFIFQYDNMILVGDFISYHTFYRNWVFKCNCVH